MSPITLRRYRAERLLRDQFTRLRTRVLAGARRQLRASGVTIDQADLEACYAQAWQGLYTATLEGKQIANPTAWLTLVTFRRALEEHRARARAELSTAWVSPARVGPARFARRRHEWESETPSARERDLAAELDDRMRLRHLFEALRGRLDAREREAATLCYLQGLSRAQAAARMGVSEARMRKLMDGRGPLQPGVACKVGALVRSIRDGEWCEEQGSLMRALAYGLLDPGGERYPLARMHHDQCPACRAYVLSLRGLAVVLPPVFLPWALGAGVLSSVAEGGHALGTVGAGSAGVGATTSAAGTASAGAAAGGGAAVGVGGAAIGGAAGGGWLLAAGPFSAKLALGCLVALGIGAGCIALEGGHPTRVPTSSVARRPPRSLVQVAAPVGGYAVTAVPAPSVVPRAGSLLVARPGASGPVGAEREFGPEQPPSARTASADVARSLPTARAASSDAGAATASARPSRGTPSAIDTPASGEPPSASLSARDSAAAEREFAPG